MYSISAKPQAEHAYELKLVNQSIVKRHALTVHILYTVVDVTHSDGLVDKEAASAL